METCNCKNCKVESVPEISVWDIADRIFAGGLVFVLFLVAVLAFFIRM